MELRTATAGLPRRYAAIMQAGIAPLFHDAAVLHTFADFIEQYCAEQGRAQRYIDASADFFTYAQKVAAGIKQKILADVAGAESLLMSTAPSRIDNLRREIATFKSYLRLLHTFIKPAADAHTLNIPAPLTTLACDHLRSIRGMGGAKVAILLTPHLNYFQRPHTQIREQATIVEQLIPDAKFPEKLGFIELPYSQGPNFFTNLAIYHELGHFVYEEILTLPAFETFATKLRMATDESLTFSKLKKKDVQLRALAREIIEAWKQEIFCDLLALRLIGPAFSFALVEILSLRGAGASDTMMTFDQEHPAPAYRLAQHLKYLRDESSWWEAIRDVNPEQKLLIENLAKVNRAKYKVYEETFSIAIVHAFLDHPIVPTVRELVASLVPDANDGAKRFKDQRSRIDECLGVGVVPHGKGKATPDPVSIINAAFCFYLTTLPEIVAKFEGRKKRSDVEIRSKWVRKLEGWTLKAIEDSQITSQFRRGQQSGSVTE